MVRLVILVVDDDDSLRRSLERLLLAEGYEVQSFKTAEDFLASSLPNAACLVLDVYLPGMDGVELQYQLARTGPRLPVVAISAHGEDSTGRRALAAGATAFLTKPFRPSDLLDAIERATAKAS